MSKFVNFLIKLGINTSSMEMIGGRLVGSLSALNATNAGGYMDSRNIDGYTYGRWSLVWVSSEA